MKLQPWSFSRLNSFVTCPKQLYEIQIAKNVPDEQGEVAAWGERGHKAIEDYINDNVAIPPEFYPYTAQIAGALVRAHAEIQWPGVFRAAELKLALSSKILPCEWQADNVWCRGILDVCTVAQDEAWVLDWKFGKVKPDSRQLKLFALLVFHHYPEVETVYTAFEWLQFGQKTEDRFYRGQVPAMWQAFMADLTQYRQAFLTDTWQARPSGLCHKHCPVTSCFHNGRNK